MKSGIILALIFVTAFMLTTVGIIYYNSQYNNIFKFDFSPALSEQSITQKIIAKQDSIKKAQNDSLKTTDSLKVSMNGGSPVKDSLGLKQVNANNTKADIKENSVVEKGAAIQKDSKNAVPQNVSTATEEKQDKLKDDKQLTTDVNKDLSKNMASDDYKNWRKKTIAIMESMDPKKASNILKNYADNVGRDIIYTMKKKKAAEILSYLDASTVQKLTKVQ